MDILVTGATGTVGREVLRALGPGGHRLFAGVRDPARAALPDAVTPCAVDLATGTGPARRFDAIFLMRPPQIADPAPFRTFLAAHDRATRIVFLSVQGAEARGYLPHAKIEAVIAEMGFDRCFLRPAYFMENLVTTLAPELRRTGRIYLPAGRLRLDWVSARDIADVAAKVLTGQTEWGQTEWGQTDLGQTEWGQTDLGQTDSPAVTIASGRGLGFAEALEIVNAAAGTAFRYEPAALPAYLRHARTQGLGWGMIGVMLLLHTLPRLSRQAFTPGGAEVVLGRPMETLGDWAGRNAPALRQIAGTGPGGQ